MAARAAAMDGAGQHALARSSLADEENGRQPHRIRGAIEQPRDLGANSAKRPALTDQFRKKHDPYGNAGLVSRSMGAHPFRIERSFLPSSASKSLPFQRFRHGIPIAQDPPRKQFASLQCPRGRERRTFRRSDRSDSPQKIVPGMARAPRPRRGGGNAPDRSPSHGSPRGGFYGHARRA